MDSATWIRAARRARRLSQRELAEVTGVPVGTIARAEAGVNEPRLTTFLSIMGALGYELQLIDWRGRLLADDEEHERFRDTSGRRCPAHLLSGRTPTPWQGYWWGYFRIAWSVEQAPPYVYWRRTSIQRHQIGTNYGHNELWDDAT